MPPARLPIALLLLPSMVVAKMEPMMGKLTSCDNARENLEIDWNPADFTVYTCPSPQRWTPDVSIRPFYYEIPNFDPTKDEVDHRCINESIVYADSPPLRGEHRPNWPVYGTYLYVPPQRWLHNLEHGAVVLLYHPCVDSGELQSAMDVLRGCLRRHIITPFPWLNQTYPLTLVTWGTKLQLNTVHRPTLIDYIKKHAHRAPEEISREGKFDSFLVARAEIVSDLDDSRVCPSEDATVEKP